MIKSLFKAFTAAFSIYSKIPMPHFKWDTQDMKYHLIFFPFVGLIIGIAEYYLVQLLANKGFSSISISCIFIAVILLITGGIHLDGFMDTSDALKSFKDSNKKLEILSDPHVGAFCVISLLTLVLIYLFGLNSILDGYVNNNYFIKNNLINNYLLIICIYFFISRCISGILLLSLKPARQNGMLRCERDNSDKNIVKIFLFIFLIISLIIIFIINIFATICMLLSQAVFLIYFIKIITREFNGVTGDLLGYYVCVSEVIAPVSLVIVNLFIN